jgi:hypothetical protein
VIEDTQREITKLKRGVQELLIKDIRDGLQN